MKTKRLSVDCPPAVIAALTAQAMVKGLSLQAYMRLVLAQHAKTPMLIKVPTEMRKAAPNG